MLERSNIPSLVLLLVTLFAPRTTAWTSVAGTMARSSIVQSASVLFMTAPDKVRKTRKAKQANKQPENILEDGFGHINPDLAHTLWSWEQQHREDANLPKLAFSTRQGLRLVDGIVKKVAESSRGQKFLKGNDDTTTDLVQEGIMALMDALNDYRESQEQQQEAQQFGSNRTTMEDRNLHFEAYARPYIEERLWCILDETSRPMQLPEKMSNLWKKVQQVRPQLQDELGGREPTTEELAARLKMPVEKLEMLMRTRLSSLSVESTVEIKNPDSLEDRTAHFTDQDKWDEREGHLLDTGNKVIKDEYVEDFMDEYQYEGEDEMWIHQEQIAGPLREIIPDGGPSPDDIALSEMIRHDVGEFLTKTLTPDEVKVVRMSFGLDGVGKQSQSMNDVAAAMGVSVSDAKESLKGALAKLRTSYRNDYVETYLEDETDFFGEDSV